MSDLTNRFLPAHPWPTEAITELEEELTKIRARLRDVALEYGEALDRSTDPAVTSRERHLARLRCRSLARTKARLQAHTRKLEKQLNDMRGGVP